MKNALGEGLITRLASHLHSILNPQTVVCGASDGCLWALRLHTKTETYKATKLMRTPLSVLRVGQLISAVYLVFPSMLPNGLGLTLSSFHRYGKGGLKKVK